MKIKIIKPIRISSVGKTVLPIDHECEVNDKAGKIYVSKGYAEEVKSSGGGSGDGNHPGNVSEVEKLIKAVTKIEDLVPFEKDTRAGVKTAYDAKKAELTAE